MHCMAPFVSVLPLREERVQFPEQLRVDAAAATAAAHAEFYMK